MRLIILSTAFILGISTVLASNTINVPKDYPTIQQAIDAAVDYDTVLVAPGTYVENIDFKGKALLLTSSNGSSDTVIDGNKLDSVVKFINLEDVELSVVTGTLKPGERKKAYDDKIVRGIFATPQTIRNDLARDIMSLDNFSLLVGNKLTPPAVKALLDLGEANIVASFSEISVGESGNLNIESTSSRYDLKSTGNITTESRRDKFYIGSASSVKGNSYFSDIRIDNLKSAIELTARYGSINTEGIGRQFELININSGFCDINLSFEPSSSYSLDLKYINTFITLPGNSESFERKAVNEDKKEYMVYGNVGKEPANRKVRIDANRGSILIK